MMKNAFITNLQPNMNTLPWGPGLLHPRDTPCVLGVFWRCDTPSRGLRSHPDRKASELPRVWRTPLSQYLFPPLSQQLRFLLGPSCAPVPSGRCQRHSSASGSLWAPSGSTSSCRWDTHAWPSSCSRTAAGSLCKNCGCTSAPRGPWRSHSKQDRITPVRAPSPTARKPPVAG